ncbi:biotin--[acetyl-CoA-carboxylase] ligase [Periweissella fabaria]|uniref:Bifunctional ligase/repressor BirA n=1 Tax=Periweissella fabaria TaxID=546157 RepID=A0ABN8BLU9_9LACO|nr:biotin--[acetyl-CoA-carboxylase] ligase [Periweissella fabaria]MCM0597547.1 biotin--[acetyl-CoA-carboxylase] ligase [Periweissella fabaria]CAH0416730.1 Bifunctional ligase/repressor BirA [Periweissella fabaria]
MKTEILSYLMQHTDEDTSGEQLATRYQVSRNAVWKVIKQLQAEGYLIESQHRRGYRYLGTKNLSAEQIAVHLQHSLQVQVFQTIDSTNKLAKQLATENPSRPLAIIANQQTAGYGRYGRQYYSPKDTGVYISLLLPMANKNVTSGLLTTGAAVAVVKIFESLYHVKLQIKWVNDLIYENGKIAGIMTEGITDFETGSLSYVIVGIGINLTTSNFPIEMQAKAGSLNLQDLDRNLLVARLIDEMYQVLMGELTPALLAYYREHSLVIGHEIVLDQRGKLIQGRVVDIDNQGALVVATTTGVQIFNGGEITKVKLLDGEYHG